MKVIDAFAGIGGFSLAADSLGWETVAFVERDPDCQFWLGQHWPTVPIYGDICAVEWEDAPPCDVFTAGFPCQPHSVAGKRQASADDRDLWSECVRAIGVLRPRYAVLENVPGLLTSESGRFFNRVLSDLAALGYVGRYDVLSAAECGAPHKRERVWIVAHPVDNAHGGRCEQRHTGNGPANELGAGLAPVGDPARGGRGTGEGLEVRRALRGRDGVGDTGGARGASRLSRSGEREAGDSGKRHDGRDLFRRLAHPWADAIPYRGADGTVRLIPAGAVGHAEDARLMGTNPPSRAIGRGAGESGSGGESARCQQEEVEGPESEVRTLADGIRSPLVRCNSTKENEEAVDDYARTASAELRTQVGAEALPNRMRASQVSGVGGSLWPVTDSEPGRVARLRAVGNAVVPAWVLAGPFRYIQEREAALELEGDYALFDRTLSRS